MKADVEILSDSGTPEDVIRGMLEADRRLKGYNVIVDSPHAAYVEFGTVGAEMSSGERKYGRGQISPVRAEIREWVGKKFGIRDPRERNRRGDMVYRTIMQNGIPPYPFFRPAVHLVFNGSPSGSLQPADPADWLDKGQSLEDIAAMIAAKMQQLLMENGSVYTGELLRSIRIEQDNGSEDRQDSLNAPPQSKITEETWQSDSAHYAADKGRTGRKK